MVVPPTGGCEGVLQSGRMAQLLQPGVESSRKGFRPICQALPACASEWQLLPSLAQGDPAHQHAVLSRSSRLGWWQLQLARRWTQDLHSCRPVLHTLQNIRTCGAQLLQKSGSPLM